MHYCDYIAQQIRDALLKTPDDILGHVGSVKLDLHPEEGYMLSTKKTLQVQDNNGLSYTITVTFDEEKSDE